MAKKKNIIDAVKKIIVRKGIRGITADEIAREAKVAKGTLYLYFKSKEDIFICLLEDFLREGEVLVEKASGERAAAVKKLGNFIKYDLKFYEKNVKVFKTLGTDLGWVSNVLGTEKRKRLMERHFEIIKSVSKIVAAAMREKSVRKMEPMEGAVVLVSIIHAYVGMRIHGFENTPLHSHAGKILKLYMAGVGR